jgi:hypothetical protein
MMVGLIVSRQEEVFQYTNLLGESASVSESAFNDWYSVLAEILKKYAPRNVYNADESALYYNLLPDKTLAVMDEQGTQDISVVC